MNTKSSLPSLTNRSLAAVIFLIIFGAFFRVFRVWIGVDFVPNCAPLTAIALCGAVYLPRGAALFAPLAALLISDILLNSFYHVPIFGSEMFLIYGCYLVAWFVGLRLRNHADLPVLLGAAFGNAFLFYFVTNTMAWFANPAYAQSFSGLVQALTTGVPGYAATWTFFRNSLASDLLFTIAFFAAVKIYGRKPHAIESRAYAVSQ
ncbi:MAG: DUF6580 family putative transport protein [Chthoniobacterales bacterium]